MPIQIASPNGWITYDDDGRLMAMPSKEHFDQMGISVAPNGSLIVRYTNGEGQKVTLDLSAIIEQKAEEAVQQHVRKLHGHTI